MNSESPISTRWTTLLAYDALSFVPPRNRPEHDAASRIGESLHLANLFSHAKLR